MNNKSIVRLRSLRVTVGKHLKESLIKSFDKILLSIAEGLRTKGKLSLSFAVSLSNHERNQLVQRFPKSNNSILRGNAVSQSGAVLIISLIMLLLLTLIGITGAQVTGLEEKMAGNMRERNTAFQAGETALRAGEKFLTQATLPLFTPTGTAGLYSEAGTPPKQNDDWSTFNKITYSTASLIHTASAPLYVIQRLNIIGSSSLDAGNYNENEVYRVTARGVGGTSNTVVVVQSVYKR